MTRLERNAKLVEVLSDLRDAYRTGDFSQFVRLLSEDCVYESMWVLEPLCGKETVSNHLLRKGDAIKGSNAFPRCWIVELVGSMNPLPKSDIIVNGEKKRASIASAYESGKYCLMMEQRLDDETNGVLIDLKLDDVGRVCRMDLCIPSLFETHSFSTHISIYPSNSGNYEDEDVFDPFDTAIYVSESYFSELYAFFPVVGIEFDEYVDLVIPMDKWKEILTCWEEFVEASSYDVITEKMCGIDYSTWSIANKKAQAQLSWCGVRLWKNRKAHSTMVHDLMEWTQKYQDQFDFIRTIGC
ncbi:MAG: hypothetical protein ACOX81_07080 [Candidatus Heteroscillospira sp.]